MGPDRQLAVALAKLYAPRGDDTGQLANDVLAYEAALAAAEARAEKAEAEIERQENEKWTAENRADAAEVERDRWQEIAGKLAAALDDCKLWGWGATQDDALAAYREAKK